MSYSTRQLVISVSAFILLLLSNITKANIGTFYQQVSGDYHRYYGPSGLPTLFAGLALGGIMSNAELDFIVRDEWQDHLRSPFLNEVSNQVDNYGKLTPYQWAVPMYLGALWVSSQHETLAPLHTWANHSLRALILGAPQQWFLTNALGGGRPETGQSQWHFFRHSRAVSGHAFYGAIPLLNAAHLTDNTWLKVTAYSLSVLPALARINNDKHYASQVFLGWWLAYNATKNVWEGDKVSKKSQKWIMEWIPTPNAIYFAVNRKL